MLYYVLLKRISAHEYKPLRRWDRVNQINFLFQMARESRAPQQTAVESHLDRLHRQVNHQTNSLATHCDDTINFR